jgi:AraC-like DNA-binding protein
VPVVRKPLFQNAGLGVGLFSASNVPEAPGEIERQDTNVVVLAFNGVFSKHDAPGRQVIGTPSHAVFIAKGVPYRIGYPGGIGDRALILRFGEDLAPETIECRGSGTALGSSALLTAHAMMLRNQLRCRFALGDGEALEHEALALELLVTSLRALGRHLSPQDHSSTARRMQAIERVKEAVAAAPEEKWSVARLAEIANQSPFHLIRVFRQMVGVPLYNYVLRERLARALDAVLDSPDDLTTIALDTGFASHSHFTARFHAFFGCTPTTLRRTVRAPKIRQLRKIMTARG